MRVLFLFFASLVAPTWAEQRWIVTGQSNAYGSPGAAADFATVTNVSINPNLYTWNPSADDYDTVTSATGQTVYDGNGEWQQFDVTLSPRQYNTFTVDNTTGPNIGFYWGKKLQEITGEVVKVLVVGHGNQGIDHFNSGGTEDGGWLALKTNLEAIGWEDGSVNGIIFSQGEWDDSRWSTWGTTANDGATYLNHFLKWRADMSAMQGVDDTTPTYIVQPTDAASGNVVDAVFNKLEARTDYPFIVLPTRKLAGDVHFSALSYERIGREIMPSAWAAHESYAVSDSAPISCRLLNTDRAPDDDYEVEVTFSGATLHYSDDLQTWLHIPGATSPYTETVPRENDNRYYRSE